MSALLALAASALWGTSDFVGSLLTRRLRVLAVLLPGQLVATALLALGTTLFGDWRWAADAVGWGVLAGLAGPAALAVFYRGMAIGPMSIVAPMAATGVLVPVVAGLAQGERPHLLQLVGIVLAIGGVILAARPPAGPAADQVGALQPGTGGTFATATATATATETATETAAATATETETETATTARRASDDQPADQPRTAAVVHPHVGATPILCGLGAALGFGLVLLFVAEGSDTSVAMTLVSMRLASLVALTSAGLVIFARGGDVGRLARRDVLPVAAVGAVDLLANVLYALATDHKLVSVVAVLASLYPVMTLLLARRVLAERLARSQAAGVITALVGVLLIAGA